MSRPKCSRRPLWPWLVPAVGVTLLATVAGWWALRPRPSPRSDPVGVAWLFDTGQPGSIATAPVVTADRIYLATIRDMGLSEARGAVLALDRASRHVLWSFNDGSRMLHTISTPLLAGGRLYVGEGMHGDLPCHLYCLDAQTGKRLWAYPAGGHIESRPCVAGGLVSFSAGDDGLYALDALSGAFRWRHAGPVHVDTGPAVAAGRLFGGGAMSRRYPNSEAFCLDARTGAVGWRTPTDLPVWGSPLVDDDRVYFGLGNGRLLHSAEPPEKPAGGLLCLAVRDGKVCWRFPTPDAVFGKAAVAGPRVFFTCRDGNCYAVDRLSGALLWRRPLGSPAVTTPAVVDGRVYVAAIGGRVSCLAADSGEELWRLDVAGLTGRETRLLSSPVVLPHEDGRQILFGAELRGGRSAAVLYCLEEPRR